MAPSGHCTKGFEMEASSSRFRVRPIVVDFLGTLLATFCIGVATALVLAACVMLMAGEAPRAPGEPARAAAGREKGRAAAGRPGAVRLVLPQRPVNKYTGPRTQPRTP